MNTATTILAVFEPLPQWLNFLAVGGCMLLGALASLIWFLAFRTKRKRKRRHHEREKRPINPTLSETGGLPPKRNPNQPPTQL
jgi:hypothetical protein